MQLLRAPSLAQLNLKQYLPVLALQCKHRRFSGYALVLRCCRAFMKQDTCGIPAVVTS